MKAVVIINFNLSVGKDLFYVLGYDSRMWLAPLGIFSSNRNHKTIYQTIYQTMNKNIKIKISLK